MMPENPALYEAAKKTCHDMGFNWTDPRTGKTYPPPKGRNHKPPRKRTYLCREPGGKLKDEGFTIEAANLEDARAAAAQWNATVIREVKPVTNKRLRYD